MRRIFTSKGFDHPEAHDHYLSGAYTPTGDLSASEMPVPADPYANLVSWLHTDHEGFYSALVCRHVKDAGRGMFVSRDIAGGETLLEVPSSALLNPITLRASALNTIPLWLFPPTATDRNLESAKRRRQSLSTTRLNTTQLLTLHLVLSRDPSNRHQSAWQKYFATLPDFANWHPLTWFHAGEEDDNGGWKELLGCLTVEAKEKLGDVRRRYMDDCDVLKSVLADYQRVEEPFATQNVLDALSEVDFLWAWLNVNTRTVSIPLDILGPASLQNHTLVPVLDMLNHTSCSSAQIPHPRQFPSSSSVSVHTRAKQPSEIPPGPRISSRDIGPLIPGKIGFRLVAPHKGLRAGDEVLFEYGSHSSAMLFAEYGFVEGPYGRFVSGGSFELNENGRKMAATSAKGQDYDRIEWLDKEHGCVDLSDLVRELWKQRMGEEERVEKQMVLEALNCSDRHVLHTTPSPPHPSHALLMSLRLLHLPAHSPKLNSIRTGRICYISPANESAALQSLSVICAQARNRAAAGIERVRALHRKAIKVGQEAIRKGATGCANGEAHGPRPSLIHRSSGIEGLDNGVWAGVEGMWEEEIQVIGAVLKRIELGETDW